MGSVAPAVGSSSMSRQFTSGPGDRVVVKGDGILVNGQPIEHSARLAVDGAGRPMPPLPTAGAVPTGYV